MINNTIQFRAWDSKNKKMYYQNDLVTFHFSGNGIRSSWTCWYAYGSSEQKCVASSNCEEDVLMQYIGIKTVIDREKLYDKDIVEHKNGCRYYVKWSEINGWWCLSQPRVWETDDEGEEYSRPLESYTGGIKGQDIKRCKVIGNSCKYPDLLTNIKAVGNEKEQDEK